MSRKSTSRTREPGARALIERAGFQVSTPRAFELNILFDTPAHVLRSRGELVRIRNIYG